MGNQEEGLENLNIPHVAKLNKLVEKIHAIEAANSAIMINQAKILAVLTNRDYSETLEEVNKEYQEQLKRATKHYTNWIADFLE